MGLNALVLLAALVLLVGSQEATPPSALAYLLRPTREQVGTYLERWTRHVDGAWLVEDERTREPGEGPSLAQARVYDARAWFQAPRQRGVDALPPGAARDRALEGYRRALPPEEALAGRGLVVALLDKDREKGQRWALVAEVRDGIRGARRAYLVMLLGLGVVFLVTWVFLSRVVVRPLDDLTRAAVRVAAGDVTARLPTPTSDDELSRTAAAFNLMADEIHEYQGRLEERVLTGLEQIKKAEQHLAVAERLVATGKLAAGIAHEINNPLGGMKNAARALARGDLEPEKRAQYLELIQDGLQRVEETVKKVLAFTPRRVEPRPIDLGGVVQRALALSQHRIERKGAKVEVHLPTSADDARVFGDPLELQQVALNLLLNAADALASTGGHVRIEVRRARRGDRPRRGRQRWGAQPRGAGALLRPLLHHEGGRRGHGPGPLGGAQHREQPWWPHRARERARRGRHLHRLPAPRERGARRPERVGGAPRGHGVVKQPCREQPCREQPCREQPCRDAAVR